MEVAALPRLRRLGLPGWERLMPPPDVLDGALAAAEERLAEVSHLNEMSGPVFKSARDPRLTPAGKVTSSLRRSLISSPLKRALSSSYPSGCNSSSTPSAAATAWRVWSSGVLPMPPQENTISPAAMVRLKVAVNRARSSPTYSAHDSRRPRAPSISTIFAKCLSSRLPERISSPMMTAPKLRVMPFLPGR